MTYLDMPPAIRIAYQSRLADHGQDALARALAGHRDALPSIPDAVLGAARRSRTQIDRLAAQHVDMLRTERPEGSGDEPPERIPRPEGHVPRQIYTRDSYTPRAPLAMYLTGCAQDAEVTHVEMAERSGLPAKAISRWLTGRSVPDRKSRLLSLCEACSADPARAVELAEPHILPARLNRWRAS